MVLTKKFGQSNPIERSPELNRTMAYTTHNTVNRLARKELNSNPVVLELSKEKETYSIPANSHALGVSLTAAG